MKYGMQAQGMQTASRREPPLGGYGTQTRRSAPRQAPSRLACLKSTADQKTPTSPVPLPVSSSDPRPPNNPTKTPNQDKKGGDAPPYAGPLTVDRPEPVPWNDVVLMQGFGWDSSSHSDDWYPTVQDKIPEMKKVGVTHLWLPPPSRSVAPEGYLPTQLYDLDASAYGCKTSLIELNTALLKADIRPVADIVINHRCADEQDENGVWNKYKDVVAHPGMRIGWGRWAITSTDPDFDGKGSPDTGRSYAPSPDLDHTNEKVQAGLIDWMTWLRTHVGFEGWRFDYAVGYAPHYMKLYMHKTLANPGKDFNVAEYWIDANWNDSYLDYDQNSMRQGLCDFMDEVGGDCATFDFPTKALLQEAVRDCEYDRLRDSEGKASGLIGWWPDRAVTFVENHDTLEHWPFPTDDAGIKIAQGYAYILTHPGMPCIFWKHIFEWGGDLQAQIMKLAEVRQRAGVHASSPLEILAAEPDMYVAKINGNVMVKLGPKIDMGDLVPDKEQGWKKEASGEDWAVWGVDLS